MTCFQDLWISYRGPIDSLYVCGERFSVSELTELCVLITAPDVRAHYPWSLMALMLLTSLTSPVGVQGLTSDCGHTTVIRSSHPGSETATEP